MAEIDPRTSLRKRMLLRVSLAIIAVLLIGGLAYVEFAHDNAVIVTPAAPKPLPPAKSPTSPVVSEARARAAATPVDDGSTAGGTTDKDHAADESSR